MAGKKTVKKPEEPEDETVETTVEAPEEDTSGKWPGEPWHTR